MSRAGGHTLQELLLQRAERTPELGAFAEQARSDGAWQAIGWRDYVDLVSTVARALGEVGVRRGDRLAILAPVSLKWELLHHAALSLGVVVLGLDARDMPRRISSMLVDGDAQVLAVPDLGTARGLAIESEPAIRLVICLDEVDHDYPAGAMGWYRLLELGAACPDRGFPEVRDQDLATIIFTSGTTGSPKGIPYTHGQLMLAAEAIRDAFAFIGEGSRMLCWLPLSNLFQRIVNLAGIVGGCCTYLSPDPSRVMQAVKSVAPDIFIGVPRFYEKLYAGIMRSIDGMSPAERVVTASALSVSREYTRTVLAGRKVPAWLAAARKVSDRLVLRRIRAAMGGRIVCMVTGSAPTPRWLLEEMHVFGWTVLEAYGMSENVIPTAINRLDDFRFGTVGKPMAANEVAISADGEVLVRGPGVFTGYLDAHGSGSGLDSNGFYHSGDLGEFDEDGFLKLTGRKSEILKTSTGRRIPAAYIEGELRRVPGVEHAMVACGGRKFPVALLSCPHCSGLKARETLRRLLTEQLESLPEHERPLGLAIVDSEFTIQGGELTANMKLRRSEIERSYAGSLDELYMRIDSSVERAPGSPVFQWPSKIGN